MALGRVILCLFALVRFTCGRSVNEVMRGDVTTLYTGDEYGYKYFWLQMYQRDYLIFHVKACSDVHIALVQQRTDTSYNFTEVVLGGWYNSKSVFRTGLGNKAHYLDVETPSLLSCGEFRTFWISWRDGGLRVGRGPIDGSQSFMHLNRIGPVAHMIQYVGFSTGYGNTGIWQLYENQGYYLIVETPDNFNYQYMWKTTDYKNNHFRFWVQAKHDVHINLSPTHGTVYYEVLIGGSENTKSAIRIGTINKVEHFENGIVSDQELREFWISWTGGTISCGKGSDVGSNTIMTWTDVGFVGINHLSVSAGYGSSALWIFNDDLENVFIYRTIQDSQTSQDFRQFVTLDRREHLFVEVQACSDMWLILASSAGDVDDLSLQVYIGTENNTKHGVRDRYSQPALVEVTKPGVLNCNQPVPIWMTWYNRTLRVGFGDIIGIGELMSCDISNYGDIYHSVGMVNNHQRGGYYMIRRNAGDSLWFSTPALLNYNQVFVTVVQDVYTVFRVKACRDVYVALAGLYGIYDREAYEVVFGLFGERTVIRDRVGNPDHIASVVRPDVLSCSEFRTLWIGWLDGYIRVGEGHRYGYSEIVKVLQPKPHPVNYLRFSTSTFEGIFEIEGDRGDSVILATYDQSPARWFYLEPYFRWLFFEAVGSEIHLLLADEFGDQSNAYHVYIGSNGNTQCSLWKQSTLLQTITKTSILSTENPRDFWLSWSRGRIQLGIGKNRVSGSILLDYTDPTPIDVIAFGWLVVDKSSPAFMRIWDNSALEVSSTTLNTLSDSDIGVHFWRTIRHRTWTVFAVRACSQVQLMLTAIIHSLKNEYTYSIELQDKNNMSSIYTWYGDRKRILTQVHTPDLLSCNEERHFWISWLGGHIAIGRGLRTGLHPVIAFIDLNTFKATAIAFRSLDVEATWRIPLGQDEFPVRRSRKTMQTGLNGGDIAGVVIGSIVLVGLVAGLVYIAIRPPDSVRPILYPSAGLTVVTSLSSTQPPDNTAATTSRQTSTSVNNVMSFSNPLDEYADVEIKE